MLKIEKLNSLVLKIIATITMTIDHIGVFLSQYAYKMGDPSLVNNISNIFRIIGRISFPIFIFLAIEGVIHTSNIKKYILRLGILATMMMVLQILGYYLVDTAIENLRTPFIDLIFAVLLFYLLKRKDKWSWLSLLIITYSVIAFGVELYQLNNASINVLWMPFYIRPSYSIITILLTLGFYYAREFSISVIGKNTAETDLNVIMANPYYQIYINVLSMIVIVFAALFSYLLSVISVNNFSLDYFNGAVQSYMALAAIPLLFYNGKKGYNSKILQYSFYGYFPLHLIGLYVIFMLVFH